MSETTGWITEKYDQVFNEEFIGLSRRRDNDPSFTLKDASGILRNLYIMDGNNWEGRGEVQQTTLSATISAYEHFIEESKKESLR